MHVMQALLETPLRDEYRAYLSAALLAVRQLLFGGFAAHPRVALAVNRVPCSYIEEKQYTLRIGTRHTSVQPQFHQHRY